MNSPIEIVGFICWVSFLVAIFVAVIESKKGSKILRYGGGAVFIWLIFPYTDEGVKTNSETIIWWARISFILGIITGIFNHIVKT